MTPKKLCIQCKSQLIASPWSKFCWDCKVKVMEEKTKKNRSAYFKRKQARKALQTMVAITYGK